MLLGGIGMLLGRHEMVDNDNELAMKVAKKGPAERWVGMVQSIASGGSAPHRHREPRLHLLPAAPARVE
jgi:hypothetical protein